MSPAVSELGARLVKGATSTLPAAQLQEKFPIPQDPVAGTLAEIKWGQPSGQ
jgi:hypothetical protein